MGTITTYKPKQKNIKKLQSYLLKKTKKNGN